MNNRASCITPMRVTRTALNRLKSGNLTHAHALLRCSLALAHACPTICTTVQVRLEAAHIAVIILVLRFTRMIGIVIETLIGAEEGEARLSMARATTVSMICCLRTTRISKEWIPGGGCNVNLASSMGVEGILIVKVSSDMSGWFHSCYSVPGVIREFGFHFLVQQNCFRQKYGCNNGVAILGLPPRICGSYCHGHCRALEYVVL